MRARLHDCGGDVVFTNRGDAHGCASGFTLVEVLVSVAILATGVVALSRVMVAAADITRSSGSASATVLLAAQGMEALRAREWTTLFSNVEGDVEYLDARGAVLDAGPRGSVPPAGTVFARRWSIDPVPGWSDRLIVLQVLVTPRTSGASSAGSSGGGALPGEARLVTVRYRSSP